MIVPRYWAEARVQQARTKEKPQVTVRRFGWSDTSQAEAQTMAEARAQEAFGKVTSGTILDRTEPKMPYNGADGVPIREEILAQHDEVVITRNAYGAHCLNTPDVLFADIDFGQELKVRYVLRLMLVLLAGAIGLGIWAGSSALGVAAGIAAIILAFPMSSVVQKVIVGLRGGVERSARTRIAAFVQKHPDWCLRLYRTPAGFRILVLHRTFDPLEPAVAECFAELGVDPVYATMCRNQRCFRARLTAKPWRIGMRSHMRPRPGVWPVNPERLPVRQEWIRQYEDKAAEFAACRFVETLGGGFTDSKADKVRELHDDLSQALSVREIA